MSIPLNKDNTTDRRPFLAEILPPTGRLARCLIFFVVVLLFLFHSLPAQQPADKPAPSLVRFESSDLLFLGLSDTNTPARYETRNGYSLVAIPCQGSAPPRYYRFAIVVPNALERDLLDDSADGTWQRWDIVSAALVAEGLSDRQQVDAYRNHIASVVRRELPSSGEPASSRPDDRFVQTVFETLHGKLLTGKYDVGCTHLARAIDTGDFNCVSATVLFHAMARQAGLDVCGLEMRGHALSRVRVGRQVIDLETTCPHWFHLSESERGKPVNAGYDTAWSAARRQTPPLSDRPLSGRSSNAARPSDQGKQATHLVSTDPADLPPTLPPHETPGTFREISDVQLIATIYYNRGVDELTAGRFSTAAVANIKALQLDPQNENAWRNLMATLNNWAIALASRGDYLNAAQLLDEGRLINDDYELFRANQVHTFYHWIVDADEHRDYDRALTLLRLAEDRLPNQVHLRYLNYTVRRKMANAWIASQEDRKAFEQFDLAAEIAPNGVDAVEAEIVDMTRQIRHLIDNRKLSRAVWLIDRAWERHATVQTSGFGFQASGESSGNPSPSPKPSSFALPIPVAPEVSPIFSGPIVLDDEETVPDTRIVVLPKPPASELSVVGTDSAIAARQTNERPIRPERLTTAGPSDKPVKPELLEQLRTLRADAVVAWAGESLKQRDYPEAVRRLTIGEPSRDQFSNEQVRLLRQTYSDWADALRSENRHTEAQTVLKLAADSPYLGQ